MKATSFDGVDVVLPMKIFTRSKRSDGSVCLVAEVSDIEAWSGRRVKLGRFVVQGDSADVAFAFDRYDMTPDGEDVAGLYFKPEPGQEHALRMRVEVLIIND